MTGWFRLPLRGSPLLRRPGCCSARRGSGPRRPSRNGTASAVCRPRRSARVVAREITDDFHWGEYYRSDGVLVLTDMGRRSLGRWRIERDLLCRRRDPVATGYECFQVWVSGDEVSLRQGEADRSFPIFIRRHEGGAGG